MFRSADHTTLLYPQKMPTRGGRSIGTVRWRTKATEILLLFYYYYPDTGNNTNKGHKANTTHTANES
jgi:hypothetical protein